MSSPAVDPLTSLPKWLLQQTLLWLHHSIARTSRDPLANKTDLALAALVRTRCCRQLHKAVEATLKQLYPKLTKHIDRFAFGPVLLIAELGREHAQLPIPEEGLSHFHPALHASGSVSNAIRLLRTLWQSPEWLRYSMVLRTCTFRSTQQEQYDCTSRCSRTTQGALLLEVCSRYKISSSSRRTTQQ